MWTIQKWGGLAAFATVGLALLAVLEDLVLLPAAGLGSLGGRPPEAATVLAGISDATLVLLDLLALLLGLTVILIWAGLRDRLGGLAPNRSRLAMTAASVASALFVAGATISISSRPMLADIAQEGIAETVQLSLRGVTGGLIGGGAFMFGWAAILSGWAALSKGGLPRVLSWMLLVSGVGLALLVLMSGIPGLAPAALFSVGVVAEAAVPIWSVWLGLVLWRG